MGFICAGFVATRRGGCLARPPTRNQRLTHAHAVFSLFTRFFSNSIISVKYARNCSFASFTLLIQSSHSLVGASPFFQPLAHIREAHTTNGASSCIARIDCVNVSLPDCLYSVKMTIFSLFFDESVMDRRTDRLMEEVSDNRTYIQCIIHCTLWPNVLPYAIGFRSPFRFRRLPLQKPPIAYISDSFITWPRVFSLDSRNSHLGYLYTSS